MIHAVGEKIDLPGGQQMSGFGLGCYKAQGEELVQAIRWAVQTGYRMFDTATRYLNEDQVGRGIRSCGLVREQVCVVSKLWPTSFERTQEGLRYSLRQLDIGYIDGYLLHWPGTDREARFRAWETVLEAVEHGQVRFAGVSNFLPEQIEELIEKFGVVPAVNQVELHPWYPQRETQAYCRQRGIALTAWGPIFRGHIDEVPLMQQLAERYHKSPVQVTLRWHLQKGLVVIPKSTNRERIAENAALFDFALSETDMAAIDALACDRHFGGDPRQYDGSDFLLPVQ